MSDTVVDQESADESVEQGPRVSQFSLAKGNPTDEELGAVMAVLAIAMAPRPNPKAAHDRPVAGGWNTYWRTMRRDHRPGTGAWGALL